MFGLEPIIIIFDTEYTSWEGAQERTWSGPGEFKEIVQICAIKIETEDFTELDSLKIYIKPVKNPILSEYFKNLTGISQEIVDKEGIGYLEALNKFKDWCGDIKVYSWGGDAKVMEENAKLLNIDFPFATDKHGDIRDIFEKSGIEVSKFMSSTIPTAFGAKSEQIGHDALNDARSIAQALRLLKAKGI